MRSACVIETSNDRANGWRLAAKFRACAGRFAYRPSEIQSLVKPATYVLFCTNADRLYSPRCSRRRHPVGCFMSADDNHDTVSASFCRSVGSAFQSQYPLTLQRAGLASLMERIQSQGWDLA